MADRKLPDGWRTIRFDQIANMIKQAVAKKQFFLLPHKSGRRAYFFKRFVPAIFNRMILKGAERLQRKLEAAEKT